MNLRIITKNHAADLEIGFLAKSISKSNGCATAMPTAWELTFYRKKNELTSICNYFPIRIELTFEIFMARQRRA